MISKSKRDLIKDNRQIIDLLRRHPQADRSELSAISGLSWPTIDKLLKNIPRQEAGDIDNIVIISSNQNQISHSFAQYVGISIEPKYIRAACVGLDFVQSGYEVLEKRDGLLDFAKKHNIELKENKDNNNHSVFSVEQKHEESFGSISSILGDIVDFFIELSESSQVFHLVSITIALPGIVDINDPELPIRFCPNIKCLQSVPVKMLLKDNLQQRLRSLDIPVYFEHDTQAAMLYELSRMDNDKYYQCVGPDKILACVMIDAGIGLSILHNGNLLRGRGSFGELGHLRVASPSHYNPPPQKCDCGKNNCFELNFRYHVLESRNNQMFEDRISELNDWFDNSEKYNTLCDYIGNIMNILENLLNVDAMIFCGRVVTGIEKLSNDLETIFYENVIGVPTASCKLFMGNNNPFYIAIGAGIASYYACNEGKSFPAIKL